MLQFCIEHCSVDCCKSRAFAIELRAIHNWILGEEIDRTESISVELQTHLESLSQLKLKFVDFTGLGSYWELAEAQEFLAKVQEVFEQVLVETKNKK